MTFLDFQMLLAASVFLSCIVIGGFVFFKNPTSAINRYFGLFNFAIGFWNLGDFGVLCFRDMQNLAVMSDRIAGLGGVLFVALFVRFHCAVAGENRLTARVALILSLFVPILAVMMPSPLIIREVRIDGNGFREIPGPLFPLFGLYLVWGVLYGVYKLLGVYRHADGAKRTQVRYMLAAFVFGVAAVMLYFLATQSRVVGAPAFAYAAELSYDVIMAYAILQHGALDIRTVVHKTLLWLLTSALAVVPVCVGFLIVRPWIGNSPWATVGVLASASLLMLMYARTIQPRIDHLFERRRYDLYQSVQRLAERLVLLKGAAEVSEKVVSTVSDVLYPQKAFVVVLADRASRSVFPPQTAEVQFFNDAVGDWVAQYNDIVTKQDCVTRQMGEISDALGAYLDQAGIDLLVPFVKDGVLLGILHLGSKRNLQPYTRLDLDFLNRLRTEVTVAYHNSLLFESVTELTKQLEDWNAELEQKIQLRTQELEGAYNQLKELDQAKTRFFASVSHELRTPLTLILAPLESVLKGDMGPIPDGLQRHVAVMHQNGLRLLKQINNLLDLTKLDAGRMTLECRPGDLRAFFRGLVAAVAPMAEKKYIELKGYEDAPLPRHVHFDPDRLEKVVLNLVFNAIKFTNVGGRVELRWGRSTEGQLQVQVKDTGIGIAEKDLPKLFKRFSQVDASTSRRYEGTGIGLALAKEIIELHGGRIGVESEPGRGSTFTFTIPLLIELPQDGKTETVREAGADGDVASADWTHELHVAAERQLTGISPEPTVAAEPSLSPANGRHVLVVEDNPDMREFVAFELQGDYRVLKAANGIEGMRVAGETLPDVIISDVMMPEMDGYQLCREIRKDPRTKHIPIILLTARADMAMKSK